MTPVELLRATDARLRSPRQWRKGGDTTGGRVCLVNALSEEEQEGQSAYEFLGRALPAGFISCTDYNDAPSTTFADIKALLHRAIALAEAEQP